MGASAAAPLITVASRGQVVMLVADRLQEAGEIFNRIVGELPDRPGWKTYRTNGQQRIEHESGGRIYVRGVAGDRGRGMQRIDTVVLALCQSADVTELLASFYPARIHGAGHLWVAPELAVGTLL